MHDLLRVLKVNLFEQENADFPKMFGIFPRFLVYSHPISVRSNSFLGIRRCPIDLILFASLDMLGSTSSHLLGGKNPICTTDFGV